MKILVIGSINVDFITVTDNRPEIGETVIGNQFYLKPGGKGANQALAARRIGADIDFYGKVGNDNLSEIAMSNFSKYGLERSMVQISEKPTGIANIIVSDGNNQIIVVSGANHDFHPNELDPDIFDKYDIVLLQLEINLDYVYKAIEAAKAKNKIIILNPAPLIERLPEKIIDLVDYLTPNEIEAEQLLGSDYINKLKKYSNKIIITQGEQGAMYYDGNKYVNIHAEAVEVVDTTGAGDTFNGAFAFALTKNMPLKKAVEFAVEKATESVKRLGAQ